MFNTFKKYLAPTILTWCALALAVGFVSEFKTIAKRKAEIVTINSNIEILTIRLATLEKVLEIKDKQLEELREDNKILTDMNAKLAKENIRVRRALMLERRARRIEAQGR